MTVHHAEAGIRRFKPTGRGGGSKKGKAQWYWPLVILFVADALALRAKGTRDAWFIDRKSPHSLLAFGELVEAYLPEVWTFVLECTPKHEVHKNFLRQLEKGSIDEREAHRRSRIRLLQNRTYKMHYNGTSARGRNHDPETRASQSREQLTCRVVQGHPLWKLHDKIYRGLIVSCPDWKDYL